MNERRPIRTIIILGGGTAGWLAAAYLNRALHGQVRITVVESSAIPPVGVGEATVPTMVNTLRFLGIPEEEFMRRCGATYKAAIRYVGWTTGDTGLDDAFYHPFFDRPERLLQPYGGAHFPFVGEGFSSAHLWMQRAARGEVERFDGTWSPIPGLCDAGKFGVLQADHSRTLLYAYHLDASLFAQLLKEHAMSAGVERRQEHVSDVQLDERGFVAHLQTASGQRISGDLFIDCSGFRGLIINQALKEPFISDSRYLACDAAIALPADHEEESPVPPYTTATAFSSGWSWRVPLQHRDGCGYVYSSCHLSSARAEEELRRHLGSRVTDAACANHLRMRVGRNNNAWVRNCVALGLSNCFLEPLESTAIFFIEFQLAQLVNLFPALDFAPARARAYNRSVNELYDHIRDFIVMHYAASPRRDTPFWRQVTEEATLPDSLQELLQEYRVGVLPNDALRFNLFRARSYVAILSGLGVVPDQGPPILDFVSPQAGAAMLQEVQAHRQRLLDTLPTHGH